jgi:hypothetical protein
MVLGDEAARALFRSLASRPRGHPRGRVDPDRDYDIITRYRELAPTTPPEERKHLPRRIGEELANESYSPDSIAKQVRRLLKAEEQHNARNARAELRYLKSIGVSSKDEIPKSVLSGDDPENRDIK